MVKNDHIGNEDANIVQTVKTIKLFEISTLNVQ